MDLLSTYEAETILRSTHFWMYMRKEKKDELENKKTVFQARHARNTVTIATNNEGDSVNMTKIGHKRIFFA